MHTLLNRFFEVALNEVHRYEGTINQFLGDGLWHCSGHSPMRIMPGGLSIGLALQCTFKDAELGRPHGVESQFRMGLNNGLVVVGSIGDNLRMDYSAIGDTTNLAARLQQGAEPGDILGERDHASTHPGVYPARGICQSRSARQKRSSIKCHRDASQAFSHG